MAEFSEGLTKILKNEETGFLDKARELVGDIPIYFDRPEELPRSGRQGSRLVFRVASNATPTAALRRIIHEMSHLVLCPEEDVLKPNFGMLYPKGNGEGDSRSISFDDLFTECDVVAYEDLVGDPLGLVLDRTYHQRTTRLLAMFGSRFGVKSSTLTDRIEATLARPPVPVEEFHSRWTSRAKLLLEKGESWDVDPTFLGDTKLVTGLRVVTRHGVSVIRKVASSTSCEVEGGCLTTVDRHKIALLDPQFASLPIDRMPPAVGDKIQMPFVDDDGKVFIRYGTVKRKKAGPRPVAKVEWEDGVTATHLQRDLFRV